MVNLGQNHQYTIGQARSFNPFAQVMFVPIDAVNKNRQLAVDDHVFDGFGVDAVYVRTDKGHFICVDLVPVDFVKIV